LKKFLKKNIFKTSLKNFGRSLSGGETQRLAIARSLYCSKNIIIFDEATNALDKKNENLIFKTILRLKKNNLIFIVSHNTKILNQVCDEIINLK